MGVYILQGVFERSLSFSFLKKEISIIGILSTYQYIINPTRKSYRGLDHVYFCLATFREIFFSSSGKVHNVKFTIYINCTKVFTRCWVSTHLSIKALFDFIGNCVTCACLMTRAEEFSIPFRSFVWKLRVRSISWSYNKFKYLYLKHVVSLSV